jgi:hypothetical protein
MRILSQMTQRLKLPFTSSTHSISPAERSKTKASATAIWIGMEAPAGVDAGLLEREIQAYHGELPLIHQHLGLLD